MKLSQFKFTLPKDLIAQHPLEDRDEARLMVVDRRTGEISHHIFKELPDFFNDGDVM
ncbi:MAG: S-adenosylmethionine:tRNA ribosyltransferase-isomerase, partial [Muribaculaceae bacterium]|nr:S-adenosylmethionine:tRNA ribosyltransferase-isomerase [Muribaculaceae bacterium]